MKRFYDEVDKLGRLSRDFGKITVPFRVRCLSKAEVYDWGYSFKKKSIDVVLVGEVGSWFTEECYNFRLYWLGVKLPICWPVFYNVSKM